VVSLADNAKILHLETGFGQLFHGGFRRLVVCEDGDDCVSFFHLILLRDGMAPGNGLLRRPRQGQTRARDWRVATSNTLILGSVIY
jgi:hypothetical protein